MGADARAALFRGVVGNGRSYAVKTSTGPQPGIAVAGHLAGAGVPGVPAPLPSHEGGLTSEREGVRLSVVPWVSDRRGLDVGLEPGHWRSLGALLAAVHRVPVDTAGLRALPSVDHDPGPLLVRLAELDRRLGTTGAVDPHVGALLRLWGAGRDRLLAVGEVARTAASDTQAWTDAPTVVAHTDPHPGNVLLADDDAHGVWLVDWDDAARATPEWDLMFVVGGVLATPTPADQAAFVEGYGPVRLDPVRLRYVQSTRALHDVLDFADDVLATDRLAEAHRRWSVEVLSGQLSPGGLVAFALGERGSDRLGP
ncbi:phosphotransferase enzyme family protein [Pedococcus sp. NPDC057267]|uniref:phosphotransferase enzyme family protein n=1 Tax=Pedococcus sp. NPDC057267 TaxID=3346077 RepID=UPI0036383F78